MVRQPLRQNVNSLTANSTAYSPPFKCLHMTLRKFRISLSMKEDSKAFRTEKVHILMMFHKYILKSVGADFDRVNAFLDADKNERKY